MWRYLLITSYLYFLRRSIVLIHGLNGHAWNTFAREQTLPDLRVTNNPCWMRDELPGQLRTKEVYAKLLTYGYNANVWGGTVEGNISKPVVALCELLRAEREMVSYLLLRHRHVTKIGSQIC